MEKDSKDIKNTNIDNNKSKLTPKQKEIIITVVVLIFAIIVGFFIGKGLYEAMYGPI